ncbi:regulator of g protein signaling domain containing protein [Acanthamoeba castellanii str. Neff]|uniref:Regulator of g protein signaling domain containing protein n=1 Tax=Acanthamoeba castellanii (strain ATCC 30010 / Neff) TaxID=1257118 RepID=L8GUR6_ACACF|nr:regulator of g protein signaling domain containing protein [Acanthamoeba castellanii str. Neff]ELR16662.1 regulator of g protein signaling domain containing protein [Acanthamoeba castellanii str. Neff]
MSEQYCQLGGGARYWHTRCVESSRARRETTMMLMHSMNQLASTFIGRLSTGTMAPDDQDADDRSTSNNTSDLDTADCFSSATEGDYTIRSDRGGGGGGGGGGRGRKAVTVWDDSDVSDVDITLRGHNVVGSMRGSSSPSSKRRPPVVVTNASSSPSPSPSPSPFETVRRGMAPWGASLRPHGTFYRSLSFELDSAGNTIRPKPKRQKDKDAKEKSRKDKHPRFSPHKNNNSSTNNSNAGDGGEGRMMAMSSSSAMLSPRRTTQLQQLQQHPLSGSLSSLSSDDETPKDRPRMRKKTKGSSDKGNPNARSKCGTCAEVIAKDGNYVFVNGNKHHIDCFFCSSCLRPRFYELKDGKTVCVECLPQCDGCNLPLIPVTGGKHGRLRTHSNGNSNNNGASCAAGPTSAGDNGSNSGLASIQHNKENINVNPPLFASGDESREKTGGGGGGGGGTTSAGQEDKEDGEAEMVIERDGVVQRFHRKCILKCPSCRLPIQRKRGKLYKKQGKPWCAKCITKCSVFEDKALVVVKPQAGSKSRSTSIQGTHHGPNTIEELLGEELGLHSFIDFMVHDYSVENILFYLDVEAFKRLKRKQDILSQANNIYNKYLTTEAELELASIDAEERKKLTYILANKTGKVKNNFFEALQKHIYSFLKENAFPRYLKSDECRALHKASGVPPSSPGSSSAS